MDLVKKNNELTVLEKKIPIRSIPEEKLNSIILTDFTVWVADLLSLTNEVSANRLTIALPAIKKHCWSMGFDEITKMFTMFVDGELSVKPIPNYFDRILLGKIVEAYKEQKPKPKPIQIENKLPEEEKEKIVKEGVLRVYKEFLETGVVPNGSSHVYDLLYQLGVFPIHTEKFRNKIKLQAINNLKIDARKNIRLSEVEKAKEKIRNSQGVKGECKRIILTNFFNDCKEWDINMKEKIQL